MPCKSSHPEPLDASGASNTVSAIFHTPLTPSLTRWTALYQTLRSSSALRDPVRLCLCEP